MGCFDVIESLCSAFLWFGSPHKTHKAKFKWEHFCYPRLEGGLGLCRFKDSSKFFALSLIWRLFTQSGSLWVFWVQHCMLQHSLFWDVREDNKGSWIWRKLLLLKQLAYPFIQIVVGNGRKAFFWFDDWLEMGKLYDITGATCTCYLGVRRGAWVSEAVSQGQWRVRGQRSRHFQALHAKIQVMHVPQSDLGEDVYIWCHSIDNYKDHFSAGHTWD